MDETLNHSYNTRSKEIKINNNTSGINNYNKPKFIVELSGEKKIIKTSEDYKIVLNDFISLSNKLIKSRSRKESTSIRNLLIYDSDSDSDDSDYKPDKDIQSSKCFSSKYIKYSQTEREYFSKLNVEEQNNIKKLEKELKKSRLIKKPVRFKILELESLSNESKYNIIEKIEQLKKLDSTDNEYFKLSNWISWLDKVPFNKFTNINVNNTPGDISKFLLNAKNTMDKAVYGHREAKDQIIINMAKMITNNKSKGTCIAIQGPMGNGKTTLGSETGL